MKFQIFSLLFLALSATVEAVALPAKSHLGIKKVVNKVALTNMLYLQALEFTDNLKGTMEEFVNEVREGLEPEILESLLSNFCDERTDTPRLLVKRKGGSLKLILTSLKMFFKGASKAAPAVADVVALNY